jgi:hypothetical protein
MHKANPFITAADYRPHGPPSAAALRAKAAASPQLALF